MLAKYYFTIKLPAMNNKNIMNNIKILLNNFLIVALLFSLASCSSVGHKKITNDNFNYNEVIGQASNQQMLLNLVRLYHYDVPVFLSISSVLTQYVYSGSLGLSASTGNSGGFNNDSAGIDNRITYIERPTITYTPLTGQEFAQQLLEPIDRITLFSLAHSGWPAEELLIMGLERLGPFKNISIDTSRPENEKSLNEFVEAIQLLLKLSNSNAIGMRLDPHPELAGERINTLYFENNSSGQSRQLWEEFKEKLKLDKQRDEFYVVDKAIGIDSDEILLRSRSLLALMSHLSNGIVTDNETPDSDHTISKNQMLRSKMIPIAILKSSEAPSNAFVSVRYNNEWYYIENTDNKSKQTFGILTYIYMLQSPEPPSAGPVVTVPTN